MARQRRVAPVGVAQHVIQRGNNRQVCFASANDRLAYLARLCEYAEKFDVEVHAWVLMSNHVHLLCTPRATAAISQMMQSLGRVYVSSFNRRHQRTGTLWEGRYKSCLVENESYLLRVYRYIEMNPVRAGMVDDPADYRWSSYWFNALGRECNLRTPHALYLALGHTVAERLERYRSLFSDSFATGWLDEIRRSTDKELALGDAPFLQRMELLTGQRMTPGRRGRPFAENGVRVK